MKQLIQTLKDQLRAKKQQKELERLRELVSNKPKRKPAMKSVSKR